ncbi:MAG: HAMP domain-containing histidine kinase [Proteobacteria bacterium]|nr:HAMP domain-containing histidine kinase [Pseudomonadota bacterium]
MHSRARGRLVVALSLMVLIPAALLGWLAREVVVADRHRAQRALGSLVGGELHQAEARVLGVLERRRAELLDRGPTPTDTAALRVLVAEQAAVRQVFLLGSDGRRLHPPALGPLSVEEEAFLQRVRGLLADPLQLVVADEEGASPKKTRPTAAAPGAAQGWYAWFWEDGLQLLLWQRSSAGYLIGFELDRYRLLADLAAALPDTPRGRLADPRRRTVLVDERGEALYEWGGYDPAPGASPAASIALAAPLQAWRLRGFIDPRVTAASTGRSLALAAGAGVLAVTLALGGLALFLWRESTRAAREAAQRVSFVSRVSHELKTPLTNIRMYSELLEADFGAGDPRAAGYLQIVNSECRRLSRLIDNVLSFARQQRTAPLLRRSVGQVDALVRELITAFEPAFAARGVQLVFSGQAERPVWVDADALRQILNNLLSNAEKYASGGKVVQVSTRARAHTTEIRVSDQGPGISATQAERVFEPFVRLSSALDEGASGTGIGLGIARELARAHGGDLVLEQDEGGAPAPRGATFVVTLRTEAAADPAAGAEPPSAATTDSRDRA